VVVVDTTVWIDYFAGRATPQVDWLERELTSQRLGLTDLMVCEILQGISSDKQAATVLTALKRFEILDSGGVDVAAASAANYRTLRGHGITVRKTIDCVIATVCLRGGHELLHNDRDFDPFEATLGLRVVHC
jgi:predicted nucleic acid-binding protein